jgi:hypothetical protein
MIISADLHVFLDSDSSVRKSGKILAVYEKSKFC